jgi:hypothetical protein
MSHRERAQVRFIRLHWSDPIQIFFQSGIRTTSFRIGQIAGGQPNSAWAITDWVPLLVKSSIALNAPLSMVGVRKVSAPIFILVAFK